MVCHRGVCHISNHLNGRESNQQGSTLESVGTRRNINLIHYNLIGRSTRVIEALLGICKVWHFESLRIEKSINWDHTFSIPISFLEHDF